MCALWRSQERSSRCTRNSPKENNSECKRSKEPRAYSLFLELGVLKFKDLVEYNSRIVGHGIWHNTLPANIRSDFEKVTSIGRETRAMVAMNLRVPFCKKKFLESAPCFTVPSAWNGVDTELKSHVKIKTFKKALRKNYFESYRREPKCTRKGCYSCARS